MYGFSQKFYIGIIFQLPEFKCNKTSDVCGWKYGKSSGALSFDPHKFLLAAENRFWKQHLLEISVTYYSNIK